MDYRQLRKILRERIDAPGVAQAADAVEEEETQMDIQSSAESTEVQMPSAVQELPVHDLPVNVADLVGDELMEPPLRDATYMPGNLQQLQNAATILVSQVPPLQVQDFYHQLKRLIGTAIRQENIAGEEEEQVMAQPGPDQAIKRSDQEEENESDVPQSAAVSESVKRIRHVIRQQVMEHRVRNVVRTILSEGIGAEMVSDPEFLLNSQWSDIASALGDSGKAAVIKALETALASAQRYDDDDSRRAAAVADSYLLQLDPKRGSSVDDDEPKERAATGKTGSEAEQLKKIADELGCGVSGVRNIIGRFYEDLGVAYAGNDRARIAALEKVIPGSDALIDMFSLLALMRYYDHAELEKPVNVKALMNDITNATVTGSSAQALAGMDALKPGMPVETFADAKNSFISKYLQDEFGAKNFTMAYQGERGMETFTSRAGKEGTRPSRDPETCFKAIRRTTDDLVNDYNEVMAATQEWATSGVLPTGGNVGRWLGLLPEFSG